MKRILFTALVMLFPLLAISQEEKQIEEGLAKYMQRFPESTLQDVYKLCYQDFFGPAHLLSDETEAENRIKKELFAQPNYKFVYEPTGYMGNYYRVNVAVVQIGAISFEKYFDAFKRSAEVKNPITVEQWTELWAKIVAVAEKLDPQPKNFEADKKFIAEQMGQGNYVIDHSKNFNKTYKFRYRLIRKDIFENEIKQALDNGFQKNKNY